MSLPDIGFGSKTNHDQLGGTTYPRYMVMYAERKETSDSIPNDEDPAFGFRGATTHTTGTDAKVYMGILNGVLPTPEHNITVSNLNAGIVIETDRVTVKPGIILDPVAQGSAPAVAGSLIYNTSTGELNYHDSSGWNILTTGSGMTAHDLTGAFHTEDATGGTGNFLKADSTTTFSWQAHGLTYSSVGASPAFTKTQWTLPVFDTTTTVGDSIVSQDASATYMEVAGAVVTATGQWVAATGAPDGYIWAVSGDYPTYGIYYNSGTPDFLEFHWAAVIKTKFNMEDGAFECAAGNFNVDASGNIIDITVEAAIVDTDKFLVLDSAQVKFRTGAEAYADMGGYVTADFTTDFAAESLANLLIRTHASLSDAPSDAHHAQAHALSSADHTGDLAYTQLDAIVDIVGVGANNLLSRADHVHTDTDGSSKVTYSNLSGIPSTFTPIAHDLTSAYHTDSGLTIGHFLKATAVDAFAWAAHGLVASDVGAYTTAEVDSAIDTDIATHAALATVHQDAPALIATHAAITGAHHSQSHTLSGSDHTAAGLTVGWVIAADSATTFSWQAQSGGVSGTQWTLPVFDTTTSIGDSMVSQDSGGTLLTVGGDIKIEDDLYISQLNAVFRVISSITNKPTSIRVHPTGTEDTTSIHVCNAADTTNTGMATFQIDGLIASIGSFAAGTGTAPTTLNINDSDWDTINIGDVSSAITLGGATTLSTIAAGVADYDAFLVSDSGLVKFRTGAEVLSDIGAAAIVHNLIDTTNHPVAGLTIGHFLKADTATTYSFQAHGLVAGDVGAYTIAEVDSAIDTDISTHTAISTAHHIRYADSEAVAAVVAENPLSLTNAIKIGGNSIEDSAGSEMIGFTGSGHIDFFGSQGIPVNQDVLAWSTTNGRWEVQAQSGGGGITGSGTANVLTKWLVGGSTIQDSIISDDGSIATVAGALTVSGALKAGGDGFDVDASGNITDCGSIAMGGALTGVTSIANSTTITSQGAIYNDADNSGVYTGEGSDMRMYWSGAAGYITTSAGAIIINPATDLWLKCATGENIYFRVGASDDICNMSSGSVYMNPGVTIYTHDLSPISNNVDTIGTSTTDKYYEMFASTFNTGDIVFGNKFKISEVHHPDWDGDKDALYEDMYAHSKDDGATPGLEFWNNKGEMIAMLDEDGDFHIRGKLHEFSSIFN